MRSTGRISAGRAVGRPLLLVLVLLWSPPISHPQRRSAARPAPDPPATTCRAQKVWPRTERRGWLSARRTSQARAPGAVWRTARTPPSVEQACATAHTSARSRRGNAVLVSPPPPPPILGAVSSSSAWRSAAPSASRRPLDLETGRGVCVCVKQGDFERDVGIETTRLLSRYTQIGPTASGGSPRASWPARRRGGSAAARRTDPPVVTGRSIVLSHHITCVDGWLIQQTQSLIYLVLQHEHEFHLEHRRRLLARLLLLRRSSLRGGGHSRGERWRRRSGLRRRGAALRRGRAPRRSRAVAPPASTR